MLNIIAAGIAGLLIGVLVTRRLMSKEVARAYEKAKKEFEDKKSEISDKIGDQLSDMRSGLIRTLEAYVGAVSVVRENLPISQEKLSALIAPAKLRLTSSSGKHSNIEDSIAVEIEAVKSVLEESKDVNEAVLKPKDLEEACASSSKNEPSFEQDNTQTDAANSTEEAEAESPKVSDVSKLH